MQKKRYRSGCRVAALAAVAVALFTNGTPHARAASWSEQVAAPPKGAPLSSQLEDVSCPSSTSCVAVGEAYSEAAPTEPLAEHWDGADWIKKSFPLPAGALEIDDLNGVSCVGGPQCMAVGTVRTDGGTRGFAARFDGVRWKSRLLPRPPGSDGDAPIDVSCVPGTGLTTCVAVGIYLQPETALFRPYSLVWTPGDGWKGVKVPTPTESSYAFMGGVSCPAANWCMAVGLFYNSASDIKPWSVRWDGQTWTSVPIPQNRVGNHTLFDVDCPSTRFCAAVGDRQLLEQPGTYPNVMHWNGTAWSRKVAPSNVDAHLEGVSCPSKSSCVAVGDRKEESPIFESSYILRWANTTWAEEPSAAAAGGPSSELNAASCPASTRCTAVGSAGPIEDSQQLFVEHYA